MKRAILLLAVAGSLQAQPPLPEELAVTRSVVLQDEDELQATTAVQFFKGAQEKRLTVAGELEYGLTDRWELDAEVPYVFLNPSDAPARNGLGDVEAAIRYGIVTVSTNRPFALTAGLGVITPTGNRGRDLGEGRLWLNPSFVASDWLGPVNVQLNAGWAHAVSNGGREPQDEFEYNVALLYPVRDFFLVLEGNGESNHARTKYYVTPEIVWKPKKNVELNLAVPVGVTGQASDYGIVGSVTIEFGGVTGRGHDAD